MMVWKCESMSVLTRRVLSCGVRCNCLCLRGRPYAYVWSVCLEAGMKRAAATIVVPSRAVPHCAGGCPYRRPAGGSGLLHPPWGCVCVRVCVFEAKCGGALCAKTTWLISRNVGMWAF
eukprot:GHVU01115401.1.p1 GENE.GHVU01115401.1~~GHVU01115401.1.p1  ORF type:complete len:118 (+),score=2.84 GHVU01115401.1:146-499(+)